MDSELLAALRPTVIYCLRDPRYSGYVSIRYVGKTVSWLERRIAEHILDARASSKTYRSNWIRQLLELGLTPTISAVEITTQIAAAERERAWIAHLRNVGCPLTNLTDGGDGRWGYKAPTETRAKMSAAAKMRRYSDETREKMSASAKRRTERMREFWESDAGKAQMGRVARVFWSKDESRKIIAESRQRESFLAPRRTPEQRAIRSRAAMGNSSRRGIPLTPEHRAKLSAAQSGSNNYWFGRHQSLESNAKRSVTQRGRKLSPEHRAKISAAKRGTALLESALAASRQLCAVA